jgi:hypothetical protein
LISHHDLRPAVRNRIAKNSYRYCRISFHHVLAILALAWVFSVIGGVARRKGPS